MLYIKGIESEKIASGEIISKIVNLVEEKVKEIEKKNKCCPFQKYRV